MSEGKVETALVAGLHCSAGVQVIGAQQDQRG